MYTPIDERWLPQQAAMNQQLCGMLALPQQLVFRDLLTTAGCRDTRSIGWPQLVGPAQDATISFRSPGAKCVGGALEPCATERRWPARPWLATHAAECDRWPAADSPAAPPELSPSPISPAPARPPARPAPAPAPAGHPAQRASHGRAAVSSFARAGGGWAKCLMGCH